MPLGRQTPYEMSWFCSVGRKEKIVAKMTFFCDLFLHVEVQNPLQETRRQARQKNDLSDTGSDNRTSPWPDYVAGVDV